jgi:hypothetical protein
VRHVPEVFDTLHDFVTGVHEGTLLDVHH